MHAKELQNCLDGCPIIAAIRDDRWVAALSSSAEVLFYLECNLITVEQRIRQAHDAGKSVFIHTDLSEGIGKDRTGLAYLAKCGADGVISTKAQLIRTAEDLGILTVQRFFALGTIN